MADPDKIQQQYDTMYSTFQAMGLNPKGDNPEDLDKWIQDYISHQKEYKPLENVLLSPPPITAPKTETGAVLKVAPKQTVTMSSYPPKNNMVKKDMSDEAHYEAAKCTALENEKYCSKEGDFIKDGTIIIHGKKKVDMIIKCVEQTLDKVPVREILKEHAYESGYIGAELKPWQHTVVDELKVQHSRKILFIVDEEERQGKSFLTYNLKDAVSFEIGKSSDIKYVYKGEDIVTFDLMRISQDHINYKIIELLKKEYKI
ncbi:unnamed protein product [Mytilus coruscus]|uniref:Uncharacterized protein n=1 Tax=Mytilus coruscus TaxID=42192 RepID=A0A6J7ZYR6_MYTCO|nr:unnamed protein product [Mytilus coruscus]